MWWLLVYTHGGFWWIPVVDLGESQWWILKDSVDPSGGFWWMYVVDPGEFMWWILVDPNDGALWKLVVDPSCESL